MKINKGKAFIMVGHSSWGKSKTLNALTSNSYSIRFINICGFNIFIKRMSNDDIFYKLFEYIKSFNPKEKPFIIKAVKLT